MSASPSRAGDLPRRGPLLSDRVKEAARALLAPLVRLAQRLGITPNRVTIIGFCVVVVAAGLVGAGQLLIGAAILVAGSLLDAVDGALARATGGSTAFGSFLDSTLDRAAEAILYIGIVVYFLRASADPLAPVLLALAALCGSFMVSYTRAKAEAIGVSASVGIAPRTERLVLVVAGIGLAGLGLEIGLTGAIGIIAALAAATTVQRIWHVRQQVEESLRAAGTGDITQER
ncbi:MAG: CDP-alcohol phosphatidyltransferase family protein [Chloroflexota bacterium]|nr:CDP-alcohol phosphatidyltransferase family protein [Chloroflexota bacterium]